MMTRILGIGVALLVALGAGGRSKTFSECPRGDEEGRGVPHPFFY